MDKFLEILVLFKLPIFLLFEICVLALLGIFLVEVVKKIKSDYNASHSVETKAELVGMDYSHMSRERRAHVLRRMIAPDGIDPEPNGYLIINDAGRDVYVRSFTLSEIPSNVEFNKTFTPLFDFPSCTSSVFIEPVSPVDISRQLDKQINMLDQEITLAKENANRARKLEGQKRDVVKWANEVESGDDLFFKVGFLFSLSAESLKELNTLSDDFRNEALGKRIHVSSLFAIQPEAYECNMPLNRQVNIVSRRIKSDGIVMHLFNSKSLSTLFNYTSNSFSHKDGIPIGRTLFTNQPYVFDIYDPSHDGFTMIVAGKTGSGKSAMCKVLCERGHLLNYRFVCIDSQQRKGVFEGEYTTEAELQGGSHYLISPHTKNILNPLEIRESIYYEKDDITSGREIRTLELLEKIQLAKNDFRIMMSSKEVKDDVLNVNIDRILVDCITETYKEFGIRDKDPDSLYELGETIVDGHLTSGLVLKQMPTVTDVYKNILIQYRENRDDDMRLAYKLIINGLKDYVKELYYSELSYRFFTKEEFEELDESMFKKNTRCWYNAKQDEYEDVVEVHGVRPYFDGQSTISVSLDCPFTSIDISLLTEAEKNVAREIAINFVNENFIKVNSSGIESDDKLVIILDEAHENFQFSYARDTLANAVRTARKMHVSLWFLTQTIEEFRRYDETKDILRQATVKIVGKQDVQDEEYLRKALSLTPAQAHMICNQIGCSIDDDEEYQNQHRGEMCVIDNNRVEFIKVDIIRSTEKWAVETSTDEMRTIFKTTA